MKEYIEGGAKVVFGVRRKSECVCGDGSCVQNECEFQSCDFQQEVIHDQTHTKQQYTELTMQSQQPTPTVRAGGLAVPSGHITAGQVALAQSPGGVMA